MPSRFKDELLGYYNLGKSFFSSNQVSYLIFYVTNRCNFRCDFCFYHKEIDKGEKRDQLRKEEIRKISEKIGLLMQLSLTGGEPFLRSDLSEITRFFVKNNSTKYISIPTNGSLTERIVAYLQDVLPNFPHTYFRIALSIDGIGSEHDKIRSAPGSYKRIRATYDAAKLLREKYSNLVLDCNTVFALTSQDSVLRTVETIQHEFDFDNISVTYARGNIRNQELKKVSFENYLQVNDYLEKLKRTKEKRAFYPIWRGVRDVSREYLIRTVLQDEFITPCTAGRKLLIIGETGNVYPCEILNRSMGNIRDYNFSVKNLLAEPENKKLLKWIEISKCKCSFECALAANVLWGKPRSHWKILKSAFKNIGREER